MGRVLSLEQRVKGLQGRIAAIETRLSIPADSPACNGAPAEDFAPAAGQLDQCRVNNPDMPGDQRLAVRQMQQDAGPEMARAIKPGVDRTGVLAGTIMIGAGILLLTGNLEIMKNPLAAIGCGIAFIAVALRRKSSK